MDYKNKILDRIKEKVVIDYELLDKHNFVLGDAYYNYMCHLNSVQYVENGSMKSVILCICIKDDEPFIHFINKDKDGHYVDNTLGWQYKDIKYYKVRELTKDEMYNIEQVFTNIRKQLIDENSNKFLRKILLIDYDII